MLAPGEMASGSAPVCTGLLIGLGEAGEGRLGRLAVLSGSGLLSFPGIGSLELRYDVLLSPVFVSGPTKRRGPGDSSQQRCYLTIIRQRFANEHDDFGSRPKL